jgi:hypothetical protein
MTRKVTLRVRLRALGALAATKYGAALLTATLGYLVSTSCLLISLWLAWRGDLPRATFVLLLSVSFGQAADHNWQRSRELRPPTPRELALAMLTDDERARVEAMR